MLSIKKFVIYNMMFWICSAQETIIILLQRRYEELQIYTHVGDILIALNPFQALKIYSPQVPTHLSSSFLSRNILTIKSQIVHGLSVLYMGQFSDGQSTNLHVKGFVFSLICTVLEAVSWSKALR